MISDITSNYGVKKYIVDSLDDLENLRTTDKMGSTAYAIDPGVYFILDGNKEWTLYSPMGYGTKDLEGLLEDYNNDDNNSGGRR